MNKYILLFALLSVWLVSCKQEHAHTHTDEHGDAEVSGPEPSAYTLYTDKTELFVEFKPLVVGQECRFAAHFTALGDTFTPFREGTITLTATSDGQAVSVTSTQPEVPGIFRLRLTPKYAGTATLTFDIKTKAFSDQVVIPDVKIYANEKSALADQKAAAEEGNEIAYLKEQAWKVEFANEPLRKQPFYQVIQTSGQLLPAPGDEMVVTANTSGIVVFSGNKAIIGAPVTAGATLFTVAGGDLTEGNINTSNIQAKAAYEKAKVDFERASELVKDRIISDKEYQQTKLLYDQARIAWDAVGKSYTGKGQSVSAPMSGFVKSLLVTEGQYVQAGTPLATLSKNKKLLLQANVSQKYFDQLPSIRSANFRPAGSQTVYSTEQLHGKLSAYGKSLSAATPFIPVIFEIDNTGQLVPGAAAEIFLRSTPIPDAYVIPMSALLEEQGTFYVYVQTGGESFQKREVKLGGSDGERVQLLGGVSEGERIVTKGAYQIKLSSATGELPAHGHEH